MLWSDGRFVWRFGAWPDHELKAAGFVIAAKVMGARPARIIGKHLLPIP
jgi:hypothetical protein